MNTEGEVIWEVRPTSEADVAKGFANAQKLVKLQAAAKESPDDAALRASASLLEAIGRSQRKAPPASDLETWAKVEGVDKDILKTFETWNAEQKIAGAMRKRGACYDLLKGGTAPAAGSVYALGFFLTAAREAVAKEDGATAAKAWKGLEPEWKDYLKKNPKAPERTITMVEGIKKQVEDLQKDAAKSGADK